VVLTVLLIVAGAFMLQRGLAGTSSDGKPPSLIPPMLYTAPCPTDLAADPLALKAPNGLPDGFVPAVVISCSGDKPPLETYSTTHVAALTAAMALPSERRQPHHTCPLFRDYPLVLGFMDRDGYYLAVHAPTDICGHIRTEVSQALAAAQFQPR
jgi:hypothetical protein